MTPEEALAEALHENEGGEEHDYWRLCAESHRGEAIDILAALPHGWRLTDEQFSADAYRRGYAEGAAEVRRSFLGDE